MRIIYSPVHLNHAPPVEVFNGMREPHAEVPERIENIRLALKEKLHLTTTKPISFPVSWIKKVHRSAYVDYLRKITNEDYFYPSVFQYGVNKDIPENAIAQRGYYSFDLYTPVTKNTFNIAQESVNIALTAAQLIEKGEQAVYALCRPPGHHAEESQMGGYCYFNNSAIAAEFLSKSGKIAVLDVDFHHGNGTQHIFYERNDVLTISIHADPAIKFPFFSGNAYERGLGKGKGFNYNFPLTLGVTDKIFQHVLERACALVKNFRPRYLIVPVGFDTHKEDPIGGFALTTKYYEKMADTIRSLGIPTLIVQEGGYNTSLLGLNAVSFVKGWL